MGGKKVSETLTIINERGLHARAASAFVNVARRFDSSIEVEKDGRRVDGRSILGIVSLVGTRGTQVVVTAEGDDAEKAVAALRELFARGFEEEEGKAR